MKKKLNKTSVDYHKVFHKKLPMRKKFSRKVTKVSVVDLTDEGLATSITTEEVRIAVALSFLNCINYNLLIYSFRNRRKLEL